MANLDYKNEVKYDAPGFGEAENRSTLVSRNVTILGRRTSIRLEPEMWVALGEIAKRENCSIHDICAVVSVRKNARTSLTAAIRVFMMLYFRAATTQEGHVKAGHGDFQRMKERARVPAQVMPASVRKARSVTYPDLTRFHERSLEGAF